MPRKRYGAILALIIFSAQVFANEPGYVCHPERFTLADAEGTYAYGQGYEQYEYSFEYLSEYWTGVVYRFFQLPNTNPILTDIKPDDSEELLLQKIFRNARKALKESSIADSVSEPRVYETDQGNILIFVADSVLGQQHFSFLVQRENDGLRVYRNFHLSDKNTHSVISDEELATVMQSFVRSCNPVFI